MNKTFTTTLILIAFLATGSLAYGGDLECKATLSRAQEVVAPVGGGLARGKITVKFDAGLSKAKVDLNLRGDSANANRAHFHCGLPGENGPIVFGIVDPGPADCDPADLAAGDLECTVTNADFAGGDCTTSTVGRTVGNIAALFFASREGLIYVNVHTIDNPGGEVRGQLLCDADDDDDRKGRRRRDH